MRVVNEIYDFITGGSIASPVCVACAILAAFFMPAYRTETFVAFAVLAFVLASFEKPS